MFAIDSFLHMLHKESGDLKAGGTGPPLCGDVSVINWWNKPSVGSLIVYRAIMFLP